MAALFLIKNDLNRKLLTQIQAQNDLEVKETPHYIYIESRDGKIVLNRAQMEISEALWFNFAQAGIVGRLQRYDAEHFELED